MKPTLGFGILALFILGLVAPGTASSENITDVSRYFYKGDGRLNLLSAKNGISFNGRYRKSKGIYDEKALKTIHRLFGADNDKPVSTISLRLIEFLDFLEDNLHPGARITIVSGWRSPQYNTDLRNKGRLAAKASLHQYGMAADIKIQGTSSQRVWNTVKKLGFGGTGYYKGELVHIDVGPARSWDEKTSGVGTDISTQNKLIGLVTDYDIYLPGEMIELRFIRMTSFPIGVAPEFVLEKVEKDGQSKEIAQFKPAFAIAAKSQCPQFSNIGQMMGIGWKLPSDILPGRYKIRASFCQRLWEEMPTQVYTPEFDVIRSASASNKSLETDAYFFYRTIAFNATPNFKNRYHTLKGNTP
ncbi:MAG: YcbK family protein [Deltaproteobacteria bacterium]|nr:YcbK family protein [Deltaproteobacteria bacterium]MBW2572675.1 YcbK family protein [Deltaproteobacteria bacterium]MBW2670582.1 YcbK family protein [Deltaproteobacteria bacterium]